MGAATPPNRLPPAQHEAATPQAQERAMPVSPNDSTWGPRRPTVVEPDGAGLSLIPSSPFLLGVERSDVAETALREAVKKLPRRFDWLIIDCPPSLGVLTLSALAAVTELVVPVEAHVLALEGSGALVRTVERIQATLNPKLRIGAVVPGRVSRTRLAREVVEQLRATFGPLVTETVIRENVRLAEAPSWHQPITTYAPDANGATDYRALAGELLQKTPRAPRNIPN